MRTLMYAAAIVVLAACASAGRHSSDKPSEINASSAALPATSSAEPSPAGVRPTVSRTEPTVGFKMPNLVGMNLQNAQNEVQKNGIFFSRSHDLRGSRAQVLDSNWQVCIQTPAAGTHIKGKAADFEGAIDLGVVKLTETCP